MLNKLALALAAISLSSVAVAQSSTAPEFTANAFRSHVAFLADDLLEGRDAGSRGYDIAARYVATRYEGLGLKPAVNGGWYQQVPFVRYKLADTPPRISIGGRTFENYKDVIVGANPRELSQTVEAPVVFAGYGLDAPSAGFNDYAGLDVKGKIVAVLSGFPAGTRSDIGAHLNSQKAKMAQDRGAIGVVIIRSRAEEERRPWAAMTAMGPGHGALTWVEPTGQPYLAAPGIRVSGTLGPAAAEALFAGAPTSLSGVLNQAAQQGARPKGFALRQTLKLERQTEVEKLTSPNVLAVLPGSDPALANEYVLLMAHLDHVGIGTGTTGDQIHNGAMDNATGVATLLEVARAMMESGQRPKRSILFAAVTAEEKGLLGSQYLAKNPVVGNGKVVGVVNLDMPVLLYDFQDVIAFGGEHSTLGPIVERAGAQMGVKLIPDPLPQEGLFTRSDHYRFVQEGIPSVFLMTGFGNGGEEKFTGFLRTNYHKPSDDLSQPIDWQAGAKFARINYLIAREIADAPQAPRWYQGSFFGDTFAPNAPKAPPAGK
ncbi:MAG TPA: M28 family metallopeptidase [Allosphingosinicella sp.]|nr:M28 family metallopeptidase [Allosphingosinicella sp.]